MEGTISRLRELDRAHYLAALAFILFAVAAGIFEQKREWLLADDQITTSAMVLKDINSELFPNDPVLSSDRYKIYAPPVRIILKIATNLSGGDVEQGSRLVIPFLLIVFLFFMYLLLNELTHNSLVSFVVSLAAASRRPTLPDSFFGIWGMQSVFARTFFLAFLPLVFWLFWRYRHDRRVVWSFLLLGVISNFHPTGGYTMTPILLLTLLFCRGFNRDTIIDLFIGGVLAVVGIFPFILDYLNYPRDYLVGNDILSAVTLYPVSPDRFTGKGYLLPIPSELLIKALSVGADVIFFTLLAFIIRWRQRSAEDGFVVKIILSVLIVTVGGTALLQLWGWFRGETVWYSELMRGFRFIFIPLFIGVAFFLKSLFSIVTVLRLRWIYFAAFSVIILVYPMLPNFQILLSFHEELPLAESVEEAEELEVLITAYFYRLGFNVLPRDVAVSFIASWTGIEPERVVELLAERDMEKQDYDEIAFWALENTAVDERIIINNPHFKIKAQRELGEQIIPDAVPEPIKACFEEEDQVCLVNEARNQDARYIIVEQTFPEVALPVVFKNSTYIVYEVVVET